MYNGIITVRTSSSRLKNKCFLKIDKIKIIEHIILRCLHGNINPIICTSLNYEDKNLVKVAKKYSIDYFQGSLKNKIKRWHDCIIKKRIKNFHTIDADDPYFDYEAVKESLDILKKKKLEVVKPSYASRFGGASEGYSFSRKGIIKLYKSLNLYKFEEELDNFDTEMIDEFLDNSKLVSINYKGKKYQIKKDIRLTLDYKEDFKLIKVLYKKFGSFAKREEINKFLRKNKNIMKINYFRNSNWSSKQKSFSLPNLR